MKCSGTDIVFDIICATVFITFAVVFHKITTDEQAKRERVEYPFFLIVTFLIVGIGFLLDIFT